MKNHDAVNFATSAYDASNFGGVSLSRYPSALLP